MSDHTPVRFTHYHYSDYANEGTGSPGSGSGAIDERDDVLLFDADDEPVVVQRYLRKVGYTPWK